MKNHELSLKEQIQLIFLLIWMLFFILITGQQYNIFVMNIQVENAEPFMNPEIPLNTEIKAALIVSPQGSSFIKDKTFQDLQTKVSEQIHTIVESEHFRKDKQIDISFGVFSVNDPYVQKMNLAVKTNQNTLQCFEQVIAGFEKAQTIEQIIQNQSLKKKSLQHKPQIVLMPCITIKATRKSGFYAKMNQQFSDKGFASFGATLGYWNPLRMNDKIEVNYEGGVNQKVWKKFNYHNYALKWIVPAWKGSVELEGAHGFSLVSRGLYESVYHFSPKYINKNYSAGLEIAKRSLLIDTKSEGNLGYFTKNYMQPSNKISFKFNKDLTDNVVYNSDGIPEGQSSNIHIQSTIPFFSEAQFIKLDYNYRRYFDMYIHSRNRRNQVVKKALANSSFEIASNFNATLKKTKFVSDFLRPLTLRGFETSEMPNESSINFKASLKWNIHNFPLVYQARIRAFFFYQGGLSFERLNQNKLIPAVRSSAGWGFSFPMNNSAHLEVVYNLFQHQINSSARPINFQVRIGFND